MEFRVDHDGAPIGLDVIGAINMQNKCCEGRPVLVTKTRGFDVYSCQCACGGWCSDGFDSISKAIADYERMNQGIPSIYE